LIGWLSTLPTGHAPTSPHHGLRQRLMMGAWLSAWMARPLLVARSIGSPHHSSDASYGGTADTGVVVLEAVPDNGFMRPCAVGDRSAGRTARTGLTGWCRSARRRQRERVIEMPGGPFLCVSAYLRTVALCRTQQCRRICTRITTGRGTVVSSRAQSTRRQAAFASSRLRSRLVSSRESSRLNLSCSAVLSAPRLRHAPALH
jgi:hypothetical protein